MIQVNRIYLIFNRLVTKKFLVDTSDLLLITIRIKGIKKGLPYSASLCYRYIEYTQYHLCPPSYSLGK